MNREELEAEIFKKQQILDYLKDEKQSVDNWIDIITISDAIEKVSKDVEIPIVKSPLGYIMEDR